MCELFAAHRYQGAGTYFHQALTPVLVAPGKAEVIALPPALIRPQDGHDNQECESATAKRWLQQHAERYPGMKITIDPRATRNEIVGQIADGCRAAIEAPPSSYVEYC